jgi:hypothetical protein
MRRLAVLLAVSLSAGYVFAQDPAAADRVPIPANIETWYRIDQNREQAGYLQERITTTTMRNYRYDYLVMSDYQYTFVNAANEENTVSVSENLVAKLEEDFDIYEMDYTQLYGGTQMIVTLRTYSETEERIVRFEIKSETPVTREYKFLTSETIHLYLGPMLYRLRQMGSLAQPTRLRERVLHPGLDDPISVSYTAGALTSREILGKPVKVSEVRIEGWDRGALAPLSHIWVDKYGRIVEAESADKSITMTIVKDQGVAIGQRKGIISKGRKDPFSKSSALEPLADPTGTKRPTAPGVIRGAQDIPKVTKEKFDAVLKEAQAMVPKLQDEMARGLPEEARSTYLKILMSYKGLYGLQDIDVVKRTEVDKLKEDAERIYGGVRKLKDVISAKVDRINDLYLNDNLETWAVINDDAYREGETIQREGVKVVKIHRHAVEVEYKEEVRQVVLRK